MKNTKPSLDAMWEEFVSTLSSNEVLAEIPPSMLEVMRVSFYYGATRSLGYAILTVENMSEEEWVDYAVGLVSEGTSFILDQG